VIQRYGLFPLEDIYVCRKSGYQRTALSSRRSR
jgi:hypothetical protein